MTITPNTACHVKPVFHLPRRPPSITPRLNSHRPLPFPALFRPQTAGSAEAFKKVDHDYVAAGARLAKAAGVPHFSLVSAQGANHKCPANDFALFHALLYTRTKGLVSRRLCVPLSPSLPLFLSPSQSGRGGRGGNCHRSH
jgi:hypothetical protein